MVVLMDSYNHNLCFSNELSLRAFTDVWRLRRSGHLPPPDKSCRYAEAAGSWTIVVLSLSPPSTRPINLRRWRMLLSTFLIFLATGMPFDSAGLAHRRCANWRAAISWSMRPRTLIVGVEARESLPRQEAPTPLVRRHVPANVAVAVLALLNDAKSVAEKVQVGRVTWKSRVDDVDGIGVDIVLQTRSRFLAGAAAQCQKCQERCGCAAHGSAPLNDRRSILV